jgi:hypothetical protein
VIVALHVGGALCHRIVKYDGVLARMWPGGRMPSSCSQLQNKLALHARDRLRLRDSILVRIREFGARLWTGCRPSMKINGDMGEACRRAV